MLKFFKLKKKIIILLLAITILGAVFRFYDFFDLIFFEIDQARDYKLINNVIENGLDEFPLLGPLAGGTAFRLGSIYYIPALVMSYFFGVSPYALVILEVLFSVLTIPLFFIFLREFFNQKVSLYLTAIFSVSLFLVEYAHFSWNPNPIPFFFILALYAALKYSQKDSNKILWISILALGMGVLMQLHAVTLIGVPLIVLIYFVVLKNKITLKHLAVALGIWVVLFSPWIINDILTKGENLSEFKKATISKGERDDHPSLGKSVFMNAFNYTRYYSILLTSQNDIKELVRVESSKSLKEMVRYNISGKELKLNLLKGILGIFFVAGGFLLLIFKFVNLKNDSDKKNLGKRNFLLLVIIAQIIFGLLLFPLALKVDSRYFFPVVIMPFIMLGLAFSLIEDKFNNGKKIVLVLFIFLFFYNILGTSNWLKLAESYSLKYEKNKEFILEPYYIVTMKQWNQIVDKIVQISDEHKGNLYVQSSPYHIRPLLYLLEIDKKKPVRVMDTKNLDSNGMYFFLRESDDIKTGDALPESVAKRFDIANKYDFGSVTLVQMKIKEGQEASAQKKFSFEKGSILPRCYELEYFIEAREKCMVGDIGYLFGKNK
ncbi:MAG: ArnT family glycosyltransferase [Candidatus Moraniibacteriota bacterium]